MTQQEFTKRTQVEVSNSEFDMINEFYMNCECDKDEFCKMWVKMNPSRVKEAKVEKMLKAKDEAYRDALHKFYNKTNGETYESMVFNWAPQASFNYEFNDNAHMRVRYNGRSNQPSTSQLMPVPDNSDPLNVSLGNPYLQPYFNHNLNANFGYTNKETFTSIHGNVGGGMVDNPITNAKWYDKMGAQYSIPVNGPGNYSANGRIMVNSPLGKSDFSIFSMTNGSYNESTSFIGKGNLDSGKYYNAETAEFNYDLFHDDYPDLSKADDVFTANKTQTMSFMQRLRLTYRNDFVELVAGGRTRMSKSWYTIANANVNARSRIVSIAVVHLRPASAQRSAAAQSLANKLDFANTDAMLMAVFVLSNQIARWLQLFQPSSWTRSRESKN